MRYSQEIHWRMAAKWNGLTFEQFCELEGIEQSRLVATYETAMQVDAVVAEDARKESVRKGHKRGPHA